MIRPLRPSVLPLAKTVRKSAAGKYEVVPVLSFPKLFHLRFEAGENESRFTYGANISIFRFEKKIGFAASFKNSAFSGTAGKSRSLTSFSQNLFRTYNALNQLTEALWRIYKSNNLRLSHSLLSLIRAINEKNGSELPYISGLPNVVHIQESMIGILKKIDFSLFKQLSVLPPAGERTVFSIGKREAVRNFHTTLFRTDKSGTDLSRVIANTYAMTPLLRQIYEGIESGVYLYSADSYKNAKTLHRLTNSLWKVYLGQNLELSRSFSRLIIRVNRENQSVEFKNSQSNLFSDSRSLQSLVYGLRKAFSGGNLELRSSMIRLFSDIHHAGKRKNTSFHPSYTMRCFKVAMAILKNPAKAGAAASPSAQPFIQPAQAEGLRRRRRRCKQLYCLQQRAVYHHRSDYSLTLVCAEVVPERSQPRLTYKKVPHGGQSGADAVKKDLNRFEREMKARLGGLETPPSGFTDISEEAVRKILERAEKKQQLDWRLEKLQRGLF